MMRVGRMAWIPSGKRSKWLVVAFWLIIVVVSFSPAGKLTGAQENNIDAWLPGNAESTRALDPQAKFYGKDEAPAVIVYERAEGVTAEDLAAVEVQVGRFEALEHVERDAVGPFPSEDGKAISVVVPVDPGAGGWEGLADVVDHMRGIIDDSPAGLSGYVTGPAGNGADQGAAFEGIDGKLLYSAAAVVIVILLFTYRSPILWLLPLISVGIALFVSQAVIYLLATHAGLTVNGQSAAILSVLVFGAGTDYALLLVARYREELRRHQDRHEAMAFALHRAGPAIFASGATVVAGMLVLLVATMNSTAGLGPVSAIGVAIGLAVMLTLLPALLVIAPRWIHWPLHPDYGTEDHTQEGMWSRVGDRIARAPRRTWIVTGLALGVVSIGALQLDANGLSNAESFIKEPDSVTGQAVLAKHFPAGSGSPVVVVANADKADEVAAALAATEGIVSVGPPQVKDGTVMLEGVLAAEPDSKAAEATVERVRDNIHAVEGADALAGGNTALFQDMLTAAAEDNKRVIPLILLVVFVILVGLLRSIVAPVVLMGTVIVSFFAALGISALVFKHVLGFAGTPPDVPLYIFVFLVALGIDYNIFLMTRVHEESKEIGIRKGALVGLAATGGVITSAGLVLAGTFSVLATLPLVAIAEMGIAVAIGVLLDTIIVRAVLVTALNLDIGPLMWWPSKLWRNDPERAQG
jgi:RND superfamily putative drug exporter